jgi:hypothetical protein
VVFKPISGGHRGSETVTASRQIKSELRPIKKMNQGNLFYYSNLLQV